MTVLKGITWEHERGFDCIVAASRAYAEHAPSVTIEWDRRSLQAFADAPLAELVSTYDLLVIDHPHIPMAVEEELLAPIDGHGHDQDLARIAAESVGHSHESYAHDGRQWGLAIDAAAQVSVHRPDLIGDPPQTWDDVLALAREGRVLWPAKPIDAFSSLVTIAGAHGAAPGEGTFLADEAFGQAMEIMHRLAEAVPAENLSQNPIEVAESLAHGDHACYAPLLFGYSNYARTGYRPFRLRYRDVPEGSAGRVGSLLGGAGIVVSARSAAIDDARAFAVWVAGSEAQMGVYFDAGGQPGNARAWDDDRVNSLTDDFFRGTRATLESAVVRPRTAGYLTFQDRMSPLVTAALQHQISDERLHRALAVAASELL